MFNTFSKLRLPFQIIIAIGVVAVAAGLYVLVPKATQSAASSNVPVVSQLAGLVSEKPINVCVNTWGGFAGGQWYNGGFKASKESRFYKEQGILVNFIKMDDFDATRAAWRSGDCDLIWATVDAFVSEADGLGEFTPKLQWQIDWSRGGDVIVSNREIQSVNDLRGRKIAVAFGTPSHSLLLWMLKNSGMSPKDVEIVQVKSEPDAVSAFKARQVPAAIVWSPDDEDAIAAVPGSHALLSTKQATDIIADTLVVKDAYANGNHNKLVSLYKGWMKGNAIVNSDPKAFDEAVAMTATGYGMPPEFMRTAIKNTRLVTHGDNRNFFGLNPSYTGMKGDELYTKTGALYQQVGFISKFPAWRNVVDTGVISAASDLDSASDQTSERMKEFVTPTPETVAKASTVTSQPVTVNFAVNSAVLDARNQSIIDDKVSDTVKQFKDSYIRIEGNTDSTGNPSRNRQLSNERAQEVGRYLAATYGFNRARFIVVGNGPDKPACEERGWTGSSLDECRARNRRTEFQVLNMAP